MHTLEHLLQHMFLPGPSTFLLRFGFGGFDSVTHVFVANIFFYLPSQHQFVIPYYYNAAIWHYFLRELCYAISRYMYYLASCMLSIHIEFQDCHVLRHVIPCLACFEYFRLIKLGRGALGIYTTCHHESVY